MTTKTHKCVARETSAIVQRRPIIVYLGPGELMGVRLKGTRKTYWSTVRHFHDMCVRIEAAAQAASKKAEREARIFLRGGKLKRTIRTGRRFK